MLRTAAAKPHHQPGSVEKRTVAVAFPWRRSVSNNFCAPAQAGIMPNHQDLISSPYRKALLSAATGVPTPGGKHRARRVAFNQAKP